MKEGEDVELEKKVEESVKEEEEVEREKEVEEIVNLKIEEEVEEKEQGEDETMHKGGETKEHPDQVETLEMPIAEAGVWELDPLQDSQILQWVPKAGGDPKEAKENAKEGVKVEPKEPDEKSTAKRNKLARAS